MLDIEAEAEAEAGTADVIADEARFPEALPPEEDTDARVGVLPSDRARMATETGPAVDPGLPRRLARLLVLAVERAATVRVIEAVAVVEATREVTEADPDRRHTVIVVVRVLGARRLEAVQRKRRKIVFLRRNRAHVN